MIIVFENGKCESKIEVLQLGPKKIVNVKHLSFKDEELDDIDAVLQRIKSYASKKKCPEIWIPADSTTPADGKLEALGYKYGELPAQIPLNAPNGWLLKIGFGGR
jgi:hypothetical protein